MATQLLPTFFLDPTGKMIIGDNIVPWYQKFLEAILGDVEIDSNVPQSSWFPRYC